jgi:hypothetical protein
MNNLYLRPLELDILITRSFANSPIQFILVLRTAVQYLNTSYMLVFFSRYYTEETVPQNENLL